MPTQKELPPKSPVPDKSASRVFQYAPLVTSVVASIGWFMNNAPVTGAMMLIIGGGWEYYRRRNK